MESYNVEGNNDRRVTNIDLRKYWNNITIDGCNLINTTYGPAGGTIWIRAGEKGTGNLIMKNNYIKKSCHDETIGIFGSGVVNNVTIANNTIDFDDTNVENRSNPIINLGLETNEISNINLLNNNIKIIASGGFITVYNAKDVLISENILDITSLAQQSVSYFSANNSENVKFTNNNVKLKHDGDYNEDEIFSSFDEIYNNIIEVNTAFAIFVQNCPNFTNNEINFYKDLTDYASVFRIRDIIIDKDIIISENKFNFNIALTRTTRLINLTSSYINNHRIEVSNNSVKGIEEQESNSQFAVFFQDMKDTSPQNVYMKNNNLGFYSNNIGRNNNSTTYNVIEE